jgi:hypothetical protein
MEILEALKIMKALADGVNPETGEVMPGDVVWQNPQNVRAMHRSVGALEALEERERNKRLLPKNAGQAWTQQEDAKLCDELRTGSDFQQIAKLHDRTVASIVARLIKLGKVTAKVPPARVA